MRALVAGVGGFPEPYATEDEQADGVAVFTPLPAVTLAVQELTSALERAGAVTGGPPLLECDEGEFLRRWQDLRRQVGPGEPLVVHFAGHGIQARSGSLYLATSGGQAREDLLFDTCVSFGQLLETAENSGRPVLFLLDVCEAGQALVQQQLADFAARRRQDGPRNVWVIGACTSGAITYGARFTAAAAEVLHQLADGDLDITPTLSHVPVETLATAVDRRLARIDRAAGRPRQRLVRTPHVEADADPQPFFRNPTHTRDPHSNLLAGMDPRLREFALGCSPDLDPLHFATRAAGTPTANDILFSGRSSQLDRIQKWADGSADQGRLLVVTGNPGSGKSALLGVTACLLHPELEPLGDRIARTVEHFTPRQPDAVLAVHARQLTLRQITDSLRHQLHQQQRKSGRVTTRRALSPQGTGELLHELQAAGDVLVVLDALDEAVDASAVLNELLLPLAAVEPSAEKVGCRVMIGTRKWWDTLPALHRHLADHPDAELDLDPITGHDRRILADDLGIYLRRLLPPRRYPRDEVRHIADRLAQYTDHGAFLVASLYANHLLTTSQRTPAAPPCTITEVFDLHVETLAANDPWIRTVLNVLGQACGEGMPLDLIHTTALAHQIPDPDQVGHPLADTRRALTKAAFYLRTTSDTDHRLLYRYFHQALSEHTEPHADAAALHRALIATIPTAEDNTPDWAHAHPYLLRHAADHAATSGDGALDKLLTDPRYLLHANPDTLTPHLHQARSEQGIVHANIYRSTVAHDPRRHQAEARRGLLAFDAVAWQQPNLAQNLTRVPLHGQPVPPTPAWATRRTRPARPHTPTDAVHAVATVENSRGPLGVTGRFDGDVIVWDLTSGNRLHTLTGHTAAVYAVATVLSPRGPLAVTGGRDDKVIVWDLTSGNRLHTLTGHTDWVSEVATVRSPHGPLAVTGSFDGNAIVWDLTSGTRLHTLTGHTDEVSEVATVQSPHGPLAVTGSRDGDLIVWDLTSGNRLHTLTGHADVVYTVATVRTPQGPLAVAGSRDGDLIVWDLTSGNRLHTLTGHTDVVYTVATVRTPHGPLAVTGSFDGNAIVWDLTSGTRFHTLTGHTDWVSKVATAQTPHGSFAVTGAADSSAIVWDLSTGEAVSRCHLPNGGSHVAVVEAGFIVAYAAEVAYYTWPRGNSAGHDNGPVRLG